jgi:hypothetical protein
MSGADIAIGAGDSIASSLLIQMKDSFLFRYAGKAYTSFSVNPDGYVTLGQAAPDVPTFLNPTRVPYPELYPPINYPVIAPMINYYGVKTGSVSYKYIGSKPSRKLVIQWNTYENGSNTAKANNLFQAWLWEATGKIEYVYKNNYNSKASAIIVMLGANIYGNSYATSFLNKYPFSSSYLVNYWYRYYYGLPKGTKLSFVPSSAVPKRPYNLSFTNIAAQSVTLQWTDSSTNETYFEIQASTDSLNFTPVGYVVTTTKSTKGTSYTYKATGLASGTKYYFRVVAATEAGANTSFVSGSVKLRGKSLQGVYKVPGDFSSITTALQGVRDSGMAGPVTIELQKTYSSSGETYPITFGKDLKTDSLHCITIRPSADASGLLITTTDTSATIILDNVSNIIFDGRAANDTVSKLTIENDTTMAAAIIYQNGACHNTLAYCKVDGRTEYERAKKMGAIIFGTGNDSVGNSYNTIEHCNVGGTQEFPYSSIYSSGSALHSNSNNVIRNSNLYNGYRYDVWLDKGNTDWVLDSNSFYNNIGNYNYKEEGWIFINDTNGNNFSVSNNFFGGRGPKCSGKPDRNLSTSFASGVELITGSKRASNVDGNVFDNIYWDFGNLLTANSGRINIGTQKGNRFGSLDSSHNIISTYTIVMISAYTSKSQVANNIISGILSYENFYGILSWGNISIFNNRIGNPKYPQSILGYSGDGECVGIGLGNVANSNTYNNVVTNMYGTSIVRGIYLSDDDQTYGPAINIYKNTVYGLKGVKSVTGIFLGRGVIVGNNSKVSTVNVLNNHIHSLYSMDSTNKCSSRGIEVGYYFHANVSGNFIHNLSSRSVEFESDVTGIFTTSTLFATNNMVSLGLDSSGKSIRTSASVYGIHDIYADTLQVFHNTIYVQAPAALGPAYHSGGAQSIAIESNSLGVIGNTWDSVYNNILVSGDVSSKNNVQYNYNLFWPDGFTKSTGHDINSIYADPRLKKPDGDAHTTDLHIRDSSGAEGAGYVFKNVVYDYDGQLRSSYTPADIGADAGNYIPAPFDTVPPQITIRDTLQDVANASSRSLLNVRILDIGKGVDTGTYKPRIWFRRQSHSASSWKSSTGTLVSGNSMDGTWSFTLDYSKLSITPSVNDKYQYYIAAQDKSGNVVTDPFVGAAHADVTKQTSAPTSPYSYGIRKGLPDTIKVGTGQKYTSITNSGGLFQMLDTAFLAADLTVQVTSNLTETGTYTLTGWQQDSRHKVTVMPSDTNEKVINGGPITIYGSNDFGFDGRYKDSKRHLRFKYLKPYLTLFTLASNAGSSTIRNCIIDTRDIYYTITIGGSTKKDRDSNLILQNLFIAEKDSVSSRGYGIYSGDHYMPFYAYNTIKDNEFRNVKAPITVDKNSNGAGWNISGNSFYKDMPGLDNYYVINFMPQTGGRDTISGNYIGGSGPQCSGYRIDSNTLGLRAIYALIGSDDTIVISGNTIKNIRQYKSGYYGSFDAIRIATGNAVIKDNVIGSLTDTGSLIHRSQNAYGIINEGTGNMLITGNTISSISDPVYMGNMAAISSWGGNSIIKGNTIGSPILKNSLYMHQFSYPYNLYGANVGGVQVLHGIEVIKQSLSSIIADNKIYNFSNNGLKDDSSQTIGIFTGNGSNTVTGNTISGLSSRNRKNINFNGANTIGICAMPSAARQLISGNNISGLVNADSLGNGGVTAIYLGGSTNQSNEVSGNFIHNCFSHSKDYSTAVTGIQATGQALYANNMISLGLDSSGKSVTRPYRFAGIDKSGKYDGSFLFNSIYIGGTGIKANGSTTYAFYSRYAGNDSIINNIFFDARLNAGALNRNYAIGLADMTGAQLYNNIIYSLDTTGIIGSLNYMDLRNFKDPRLVSRLESNTIYYDPSFRHPDGDIFSADLHVQDTTIAESSGKPNYTVLYDYDGQLRSAYTATDIGADALKGTQADTSKPYIVLIPLANTDLFTDRIVTATVYDASGLSLTANLPELYYRKNASATYIKAKGKLLSGNSHIGTWGFTISSSGLSGVKTGDTIHYFVVAQDADKPAHIGSSPAGAKAKQADTLIAAPWRTYAYTIMDTTAPVISYKPLSNTGSKADRLLSADISDSTGVTNDGKRNPRIYYRKGANGKFVFSTGTLDSGTVKSGRWSFTIKASAIGGLKITDTIMYFVSAQDDNFPPNLSSAPSGVKGSYIDSIKISPPRLNSYQIIDTTGPVFNYIPLANTIYSTNRSLAVTIYDSTAIPLSGKGIPKIYYRRGSKGAYVSSVGIYDSGSVKSSVWTFNILSNRIGVALGDTVYYFLVAQDTARNPLVNISVKGGAAKNVDTVTAFPSKPDHYMIIDTLAPIITYTPLPNTISTNSPKLFARITDSTGIMSSGSNIPRVYYAKGKNGAYHSQPGTLIIGSQSARNPSFIIDGNWGFLIDTTDMGGLDLGDTVYYYVIAQDEATYSTNIGSSPAGVAAKDVNHILSLPAKLNYYVVKDSVPPVITFTPLSNTDARNVNVLVAHIKDITGIATGKLGPHIYYKKGVHGGYVSSAGKLVKGDTYSGDWSFEIKSAQTSGGIDFGDTMYYYVIAQNQARRNTYVVSNAAGVQATDVNTILSPPSFVNSYVVVDANGPRITYNLLRDIYNLHIDTLTANIYDSSAIPLTGSFVPRAYYKNGREGVYKSVAGKLSSGTAYNGNWKFAFDTAGLALAYGDTVFYHVVAQNSTRYNFKVVSSGGNMSATDVNTIAIEPGNPSSFMIRDTVAPFISYVNLRDTGLISMDTLYAVISDSSGIPLGGTNVPRAYYKKGLNGIYTSTAGMPEKGTGKKGAWSFSMDMSVLKGLTNGDTVYYYVVAQDKATVPNIGSERKGVKAKNVNTITKAPANPDHFIIVDHTPPVIDYIPFEDTTSYTGTATLHATIKDTTGVPVTGTDVPRLYYRKGLNAWYSSGGTLISGTAFNGKWDFVLDPANLGGLNLGDIVYYYVIAQDKANPVNIASREAGAVATDVNSVSKAPVAPDHFVIAHKSGIAAFTNQGALSAYPNPFSDHIYLQFESQTTERMRIELIDMKGVRMIDNYWNVKSGSNNYVLNTEVLKPGMYTLIIAGQNSFVRRQLIKVE